MRLASARTMLPPAIASVRTSSVRSIVRWPPTRAGRICGMPARIAEQSALVPPTSMKIPSVTFSCSSAPATPAAGPDSSVRMGRRSISRTSITPPSLRITISGAAIIARFTASSVMRAVRTIFGKIAALSAAVRVRARKPYIELTSCPAVANKPCARASATAAVSASGRSTANGCDTAMACAPASCKAAIARCASSPLRAKAKRAPNGTPGASSSAGNRICTRASVPNPSSSPSTPTAATSPSSNAFVACVVECAMNATSSAARAPGASRASMPRMIPAATHSGAPCVVGTLTRATTSRLCASIATTSVNVPPTSMPSRNLDVCEFIVKRAHRLYPAEELRERELFVRRVNAIVGQSDADEHLRQTENTIEARDRADGAAGADENRGLAEARLHRARRGCNRGMIARRRNGPHVAAAFNLDAHAGRRARKDVLAHDRRHALRLLIAHQARRKFCARPARDDRFASRALVPAPDAVALERGTKPLALERDAPALAAELRNAVGARLLRFVERQRAQFTQRRLIQLRHAVVKPVNRYAAVAVFQPGNDLRKRFDRVGDDAAEISGVQILVRSVHRNLPMH